MLVLQDFHRREQGLWGAHGYVPIQPTRKQQRRQWQAVYTKLAAISGEQWELLGVKPPQQQAIRSRAKQFAQNPPKPAGGFRFVLDGQKGAKRELVDIIGPAILSPDPPTRGRHHDLNSHGFRLNVEIAALHTLLAEPRVKRLWPTISSLLQRFNPTEFPPAEKAAGDVAAARVRCQDSIEKRVRKVTSYPDAIQQCLESYLDNARTLTSAR